GMGHARSMNLLGRYLEDGRFCPADLVAACEWYRLSAEAGDFRGQFSYATVLADLGRVDQALEWLRKALAGGNLKFLQISRQTLLAARAPRICAMPLAYHQQA
ncbi:sel1 repeat family protein, partial [Pseudomonas gingeri]|nr:sel1 repeat family protein [Pseudomonas gingeri]